MSQTTHLPAVRLAEFQAARRRATLARQSRLAMRCAANRLLLLQSERERPHQELPLGQRKGAQGRWRTPALGRLFSFVSPGDIYLGADYTAFARSWAARFEPELFPVAALLLRLRALDAHVLAHAQHGVQHQR